MIHIRHIFISRGHNFFGHHGRRADNNSTIEVDEIECVAGRGLRGDRFFDYQPNYKGQITFFSMEVFEALRRDLTLPDAQPAATRRNVFTRGLDLSSLIGQPFEIQGMRFEGMCEAKPCYWMNLALGPGSEEWLRGRGGLRARILRSGTLRRDRSLTPRPGRTFQEGAAPPELETDAYAAAKSF